MIALSSHKPYEDNPLYGLIQHRAFHSWLPHFDKIIYLGKPEDALESEKTVFADCEPFPRIKTIAEIASVFRDNVAVINSDIILTKDFEKVVRLFKSNRYVAATSKRLDYVTGRLVDHGLDIFIARPEVWKQVSLKVPKQLRIGHNLWDSWMIGFLNTKFKEKVGDFSHFKCVIHTEHDGRVQPFQSTIQVKDEYIQNAGMPMTKLR